MITIPLANFTDERFLHGVMVKGDIETSTECDEKFEELQVCLNKALEEARKRQLDHPNP